MVGLQLPWWTCSPSRHEGSKALPLPRASGLQKDLALALQVHFSRNLFMQIELNSL